MEKESASRRGNKILLTSRDREIFTHLSRVRCLETAQIKELVSPQLTSDKPIVRRAQKLREEGYLQRLRNQQLTRLNPDTGQYAGRIKMAYALAPRGARELNDETLMAVRWDKNNRDIKDAQIQHALMVSAVYVALTVGLRRISNMELFDWHQGEAICDHFYTDKQGRHVPRPSQTQREKQTIERRPVCPDAFFVLRRRDTDTAFPFFLEADRSTMEHARFLEKIKNYLLWRQFGLFAKRFGYSAFRVLTVTLNNPTPSENRRDTLRRSAAKFLAQHRMDGYSEWIRFAVEDDYLSDPSAIVKHIWFAPGTDKRFNLFS